MREPIYWCMHFAAQNGRGWSKEKKVGPSLVLKVQEAAFAWPLGRGCRRRPDSQSQKEADCMREAREAVDGEEEMVVVVAKTRAKRKPYTRMVVAGFLFTLEPKALMTSSARTYEKNGPGHGLAGQGSGGSFSQCKARETSETRLDLSSWTVGC